MEKFIDNLPPLFKDTFNPALKNLEKNLSKPNQFTNILAKIEDTTKIDRKYIVFGIILFLAFYLIFGYGAHFICNIIGFVYPAYASFKALESTKREDDTQWLTYWVVFAAFNIIEAFADLILYWIPFYYLLKCLLLIYLYHPTTFGAQLFYQKLLRPYLLKYQVTVDSAMQKANKLAEKLSEETIITAKNNVNNMHENNHKDN